MKRKHAILIVLIFFCCSAIAQFTKQSSDSDCAILSFTHDTLDTGPIKHNTPHINVMHYKNRGKCPLIISSISGLPQHDYWITKTFLLPGDTASLYLYYPAIEAGLFFKPISFYTNSGIKPLYLKGEVKPEEICAAMGFASDTIELGPLPYLFGKRFTIKVPSTGKCPLQYTIAMPTDYMNVTHFTSDPIPPGDSGRIDIHIGGEVTGNYYGLIHISSVNAITPQKTIYVKAEFMPPSDKGDSTNTEIKVEKEIINEGHIYQDSAPAQMMVHYQITNGGKKPLILKASKERAGMIIVPDKPIPPGKTCNISATFNTDNALGPFIWHVTLEGNFKGKAMPLYLTGNITR